MWRRRGLDDLGVVGLHGRRHDHHVGLADVAGVVPDRAPCTPSVASRAVAADRSRIAAAHGVAEVDQQLGDAAHADAADADEVDAPRASQHHASAPGSPGREHLDPVHDHAGRVGPRQPWRAAAAMAARRGRVGQQSLDAAGERRRRQVLLRPAPRPRRPRASASAFLRW